jgi:serine protease inhibitor ecotin
MAVDARWVKQQGRTPVGTKTVSGWILEVYRVGKRHQYQGLMTCPDTRASHQTLRFGGPGASLRAMAELEKQIAKLADVASWDRPGDPGGM